MGDSARFRSHGICSTFMDLTNVLKFRQSRVQIQLLLHEMETRSHFMSFVPSPATWVVTMNCQKTYCSSDHRFEFLQTPDLYRLFISP
jgi:hypothetical protein